MATLSSMLLLNLITPSRAKMPTLRWTMFSLTTDAFTSISASLFQNFVTKEKVRYVLLFLTMFSILIAVSYSIITCDLEHIDNCCPFDYFFIIN